MTPETRLQEAIGTGELISIRYHGGGQPGAAREILPIRIGGRQLRCRCYTSGKDRTLALDRIELLSIPIEPGSPGLWRPDADAPPAEFATLDDVEAIFRAPLEDAGWLVGRSIGETGECLLLYHRARGAAEIRRPVVSLNYIHPADDAPTVLGADPPPARRRIHPWSVRAAPRLERRGSWATLEPALPVFLECAGLA
ncbi:hypothetical protein L1787_10410 [Acuticoccus sp. M5D2P5]|uniref:hypothetical protein n=1 Tax=Acuticoccus kalidii TaxID=2910977 RepID=UPI001F1C5006|nr:hypothetical protein [Acuticoccus kalidii]MCF3933826.1 hypothetical protein [Acuticoccus kalidii]